LRARAARHLDLVHLHGIGKARTDEHLSALRVPGKDCGTAELGVAVGPFYDSAWNRRNALRDEVLSRGKRGLNQASLRKAKRPD